MLAKRNRQKMTDRKLWVELDGVDDEAEPSSDKKLELVWSRPVDGAVGLSMETKGGI